MEGDNEGIRVNLEARTRLPKRPAGLIKYLRHSGTHKVRSALKEKKKQKTPTLKIKLVIEIHISVHLRRLIIGKIK